MDPGPCTGEGLQLGAEPFRFSPPRGGTSVSTSTGLGSSSITSSCRGPVWFQEVSDPCSTESDGKTITRNDHGTVAAWAPGLGGRAPSMV